MFVPIWLIVLTGMLVVALALAAFRPRDSGDMLEEQRRNAPTPPPPALGPGEELDEAKVMALPQVQDALRRRRKIEAIRYVREATGLGLKESKLLVERHTRS